MKTIYMVAGLPRSGSTLLMNILGQNPRFYVTPTSEVVHILEQVRNIWDKNLAFCAMGRRQSETIKRNVLEGILRSYFRHTDRPVCFDKSRRWPEYLEMAATILGGREKIKVIVAVRDLRDVLASFEQAFRRTSALSQTPFEKDDPIKSKTALGRMAYFLDNSQNVGYAYNAIRDAATRGWLDCMHFVEYDQLTQNPKGAMEDIYAFLGETGFAHDFENVEQVTFEDDFIYGYKDLHIIRQQVRPQPPQWPKVFDQTVQNTPAWKDVEEIAQFWRTYI
ncbi:MAG: sulfotransferase [Methylobacter sp.]|nr:MAG: sulfotransferase [Methylobacter sp.]